MTRSLEDLERIRARWRTTRASLRLVDPNDAEFGSGGLARNSEDLKVRFLILPFDPETTTVEAFDKEFWEWWMQDRADPFEGAPRTNWGPLRSPSLTAAARYNRRVADPWRWDKYLALHRNGALEFGLGSEGSTKYPNRVGEGYKRAFFLITIVGRLWAALALYSEVISRYSIQGPFEVVLAMSETEGSLLGNVAAGWMDLGNWMGETPPICPEPNILIRREVEDWPKAAETRDLAFWFGTVVDETWGVIGRRFLADHRQHNAGEFDTSRYS
jgi:hypothetical protein